MSQTPIGDNSGPDGLPRLPDARTAHANDRFPGQRQDYPGWTGAMDQVPDHGEDTYPWNHRPDGLAALSTGAVSGIGRAVASAFTREGADVAFTYLPEEDGGAAHTVDALGRRDVLVNNAGFQMTVESLGDLETVRLERTFETSVHALPWRAKAALPHLSPGASIISTTSIQGCHPSSSLLDHAATKAAIISLNHSLADSLGGRGIRVNAVAPGPIWTPREPPAQPEEKFRNFGQGTPLERAGQPAELAGAYVYLADPDSTYVYGTVVGVTGGRYLA